MKPAWIRPLALTLAAVALAGCGASPPPRYHALSIAAPPQPSGSARLLVEILPVAVPDRLNREEMVLTSETGQLSVRDGDRWAAPLAGEIRQIVTDTLWYRLRAADVYRAPVAPGPSGLHQFRLALRIERFEAVSGKSAFIDGSWTARQLPEGRSVTCRAGIAIALSEPSADAAAAALSEGTGQLARLVADSIGRIDRDGTLVCPTENQ